MIAPVSLHGERLASPRLPVGKYCTVVALQIQESLGIGAKLFSWYLMCVCVGLGGKF